MRRQPAVATPHPKVFLMAAHDREQDLLRQLQIRGIEIAQNGGRIFVEIDHQFASQDLH